MSILKSGCLIGAWCAVMSTGAMGQSAVPIRQIGPVIAKTAEPLGTFAGLHEFQDGRLLVNDGSGRRLLMFIPSLATFEVVADTNHSVAINYGLPRSPLAAAPLVDFGPDSLAMSSTWNRSHLLLLDAKAEVVRVLAPPKSADFGHHRDQCGMAHRAWIHKVD